MRFGLLGSLYVERADGTALPITGAKVRVLLATLLLQPRRVVPHWQLVEAMWDGRPPANAQASLHNQVLRLRRAFGDAGAGRIRTQQPGYLLDVQDDEVDVCRFKDLYQHGRTAYLRADWTGAVANLDAALALWRGAPLVDVPAPVLLDREVPQLEESRLRAWELRIDAELNLGRHGDVIAELQSLTAAHPLREHLFSQLMLAYYRAGRQAEALAAYRRLRQTLADDLGVEPTADLQRMHRRMLAADEALLTVGGSGAGGQAAVTALPVPAQLPIPPEPFVGRRGELCRLDEIQAGVAAGGTGITVIAGTAGVGKTALAIHWAHHAAARFPDGQLYLDLRGYASTPPMRALEALSMMLVALGVPAVQIPVDVDSAAAAYRSAVSGRRLLIVLDNAAGPEQVRRLLPGEPGCQVVITSRDRLTGMIVREGATRLGLDVLTPDESRTLLAGLLGGERVGAEPVAADDLARTCAHLPLALRITAADLVDHPDRGIGEQVTRLSRGGRLDALAINGDPQSTVRTTFDLSYDALSDRTRRMFRLLGLLPGPDVTAEAAAALAATTPAHATVALDQLGQAYLLRQLPAARYGLHDLLREYAAERADLEEPPVDRDAALGRLLDWYLATVDGAARLLFPHILRLPMQRPPEGAAPLPFADRRSALTWLSSERTNLVAAVERAAECGFHRGASRLADALRGYFWQARCTADWLHAAQTGLDAAIKDDDVFGQAALRLSLGMAHHGAGALDLAIEHYAGAATQADAIGWVDGYAAATGNLGVAHEERGDLDVATRYYHSALELHRRVGYHAGVAVTLGNLGGVCLRAGRLDEAVELQRQALDMHRALGSATEAAHTLASLGHAEAALGRSDEALTHLTEALAISREVEYRYAETEALCHLAGVRHDRGQYAEAHDLAIAALTLSREIASRACEARATNYLGRIRLSQGHASEAIEHQQQAIRIARETRAVYTETRALVDLAGAWHSAGRHAMAVTDAQRALDLAARSGFQVLEGLAHDRIAAVAIDQGEDEKARQHVRMARALHRLTGYRNGRIFDEQGDDAR